MKEKYRIPFGSSIPKKVWITRETDFSIFWKESDDGPELREKKGGHYSGLFFNTEHDANKEILRSLEFKVNKAESGLRSAKHALNQFLSKHPNLSN